MRSSRFLLGTLREAPAEAEIISHKLMLRAGLIRQLGSGLYSWLPSGVKVLHKIANIIRKEMDASGAVELLMPIVQPEEIWQQSGRWESSGPELAKLQDRHQRNYCLAPTHEEVITAIARQELTSYRQLPLNLYQIQTKFRDEIRPRFGVVRAREFMMMDGYSFHTDQASLEETYRDMYDCYDRILHRIGLDYRVVEADSGNIGGRVSHEFQVLSEVGEDILVLGEGSDYAANLERVACAEPDIVRPDPVCPLEKIATPGATTIESVCQLLDLPPEKSIKTLVVKGTGSAMVAILLRGDDRLNLAKAARHDEVATPVEFVEASELKAQIGVLPGSIGPCNLNIPTLVDYRAAKVADFVCGANEEGFHFTGANWERDARADFIGDFRDITEGEPTPDGQGRVRFVRGIEVGHIFQLGCKYSEAMSATVLDDHGRQIPLAMGCYGIGVSRLVAAFIEQNHDEKGILWSKDVCPFEVVLLPLNYQRSEAVRSTSEALYQQLLDAGIEVLLDDRNERPGVKFVDSELIGVPYSVVIGERDLTSDKVELRHRREGSADKVSAAQILDVLIPKLKGS